MRGVSPGGLYGWCALLQAKPVRGFTFSSQKVAADIAHTGTDCALVRRIDSQQPEILPNAPKG